MKSESEVLGGEMQVASLAWLLHPGLDRDGAAGYDERRADRSPAKGTPGGIGETDSQGSYGWPKKTAP